PESVGDMHLPSNAVNRLSLIPEVPYQVINGVGLRVHSLDGVIVVVEPRVRIRLASELKSHLNIVRPDFLKPERAGPELRGRIVNRFVYDVPCPYPSLVAPDQRSNVVPQNLDHFVAGEVPSRQPTGKLIMPDQRMAAHFHIVGLGKINEGIGVGKIKSGSGW